MTTSSLPLTLTAAEELAEIRQLLDEAIDRNLGENALADHGDENQSTVDRLRTVLFVLGTLSDQLDDAPFCRCGEDWSPDCPACGPVGLLNMLDQIATHTTGLDEHEKAIADQLHADGVAAGIPRVEMARAARRWGYACPRCHGNGIIDGGGAAASCPECDGNPDYYEPTEE